MQTQIVQGRRIILAVIVTTLTLSALVIIVYNFVRGQDHLHQQVVRFTLTVGLCIALYRGANWARLTVVVLYWLAGMGGLLWGIILLSNNIIVGFILMTMGWIYLALAFSLCAPSVRAYCNTQNKDAKI